MKDSHANAPQTSSNGHEPVQVSSHFSCYHQAEIYGKSKVVKAPWQSFGLAVFAGAFIALAFVFYLTVTTGAGVPAAVGPGSPADNASVPLAN